MFAPHLVKCGGVEDEAEGPEVPHQLRVDPELEEEDELGVDEELRGRDEERGREVEPVGQLEQPLHTMVHLLELETKVHPKVRNHGEGPY